jgi:hypothetical protein
MIAAAYHCFAAGRWQEPVSEYVAALNESDFDGPLIVGLVGSDEQRAEALAAITASREVEQVIEAVSGDEPLTIEAARAYAKAHPADIVGYAHTKCAARHGPDSPDHALRRLATARIVRDWREALEVLEDGNDSLRSYVNFWLARCAYINTLGPVWSVMGRADAETWLGVPAILMEPAPPGRPPCTNCGCDRADENDGHPADEVWPAESHICLICLQTRLGRPLRASDFARCPENRRTRLRVASGHTDRAFQLATGARP